MSAQVDGLQQATKSCLEARRSPPARCRQSRRRKTDPDGIRTPSENPNKNACSQIRRCRFRCTRCTNQLEGGAGGPGLASHHPGMAGPAGREAGGGSGDGEWGQPENGRAVSPARVSTSTKPRHAPENGGFVDAYESRGVRGSKSLGLFCRGERDLVLQFFSRVLSRSKPCSTGRV